MRFWFRRHGSNPDAGKFAEDIWPFNNIIERCWSFCQKICVSETTNMSPGVTLSAGGVGSQHSGRTGAIPIGIVGLGFGRWIVRALQRPENASLFQIVRVCDLEPAKAHAVALEIGCEIASYSELLNDPAIPALGIFTEPQGRADLVGQAIRAGKHVVSTKPFEEDSVAALAVMEEAVRLGKIIHLNSPSPFPTPDLAVISEWQKHFHLGRPLSAQCSTWVRYDEEADGGWLDDPELCPVAPIFRLGIYLINDAIEIFGEAEEVQVMSSRIFTGRPTPDHAQLSIRFRSGALVNILASFCINDGDRYRNAMTLNFENGTVYRNTDPEGRGDSAGCLSVVVARNDKPVQIDRRSVSDMSGNYDWKSFHAAVEGNQGLPADYPKKVAAGIQVIEAMKTSERLGRPVRLEKLAVK